MYPSHLPSLLSWGKTSSSHFWRILGASELTSSGLCGSFCNKSRIRWERSTGFPSPGPGLLPLPCQPAPTPGSAPAPLASSLNKAGTFQPGQRAAGLDPFIFFPSVSTEGSPYQGGLLVKGTHTLQMSLAPYPAFIPQHLIFSFVC